jgi:hypothetical protein
MKSRDSFLTIAMTVQLRPRYVGGVNAKAVTSRVALGGRNINSPW